MWIMIKVHFCVYVNVFVFHFCVHVNIFVCECPVIPAPFVEKTMLFLFLYRIAFVLCCESLDRLWVGLFLDFLFCFLDVSFTNPLWLSYYSFKVRWETRHCESSSCVFLFQNWFVLLVHLLFHINFRMSLLISI